MSKWTKDFLFYCGSYSKNSRLLFALNTVRPSLRKNMVHRNSDICIEGFQRSGNTYFEVMFRQSNPGAVVAHHIHSTEHIKRAAQLGVPVVLLIREPSDSLASLITYDERLSPSIALSCYINYYEASLKMQSAYCLVPFQRLIEDFNEQIERLNKKFGKRFQYSKLNDDETKLLMKEHQSKYAFNRTTPFPNFYKKERNEFHKKSITSEPLYKKAASLFEEFMKISQVSL